jgi:SNF2 family DNA or RNA helicase
VRFVPNSGADRVVDVLTSALAPGSQLDLVTPELSLFAFEELHHALDELSLARLLIPASSEDQGLLGGRADRRFRNQLRNRWLADQLVAWLEEKAEVRETPTGVPQGLAVVRNPAGRPVQGITGSFGLSSDGLGTAPGNPMSLVQASETASEADALAAWFDTQWASLSSDPAAKKRLAQAAARVSAAQSPMAVYALVLHHLLGTRDGELDEDRVVNAATGIRDTVVWRRLYKFQRDGVVGAIEKLNRFGGCIIADSVGLGKTFEALAVIKYYELRNDRVLVLCPKRLRDNWTIYAANDRRNILASDRFNYDVLNHTDLSRYDGVSGDIDLAHVNWGNYDLVVIDESHNFRNKRTPKKGGETRYDRLLRQIVREGVKTRVLMLSATPVNNRMADLRNQIAFATEGDDTALSESGITSIDATTRRAQKQFNRWLELEEVERTPSRLIEMLGFDYFTLLDMLTIARSRRHIEKYYGLDETGTFPERRKPINYKPDLDLEDRFRSISDINREIRRLNLAAYAPLRYVLPHKQSEYDTKYSTELGSGRGYFRQVDREESLIHLLRVNVLKRLESSVHSFRLTVERQLADVEDTLERIEAQRDEIEELSIEDVDIDDPAFESLLVGRKIKVLLSDVDLIRWKQELIEDRNRLASLHSSAQQVTVDRDAKLSALHEMISKKAAKPINGSNRKVIVFTAFADTARYLYENLASWAEDELGIASALVTGSGANQTTLRGLRRDMASILAAFAPIAKERPVDLADEGEIDLLIATDCISEGQNLQDCDWLINYDIHWNPVRIIQRFGRIDRLGSPNSEIQLVNFWPNMELEEYINLEQRVSGRMVLLDISATGEENLIEQQSGNQMNDLDYRRRQLLKLQDAVIDLEDLSSGVSITDLTLNDFRIDLAEWRRDHAAEVAAALAGIFSATTSADEDVPPGVIFCLKHEGDPSPNSRDEYPLAPYYLVHVGHDGTVRLPYTQAKQTLDILKRQCIGRDVPDPIAQTRFDATTSDGRDMSTTRALLGAAVESILGKREEQAVESLFHPGGTTGTDGGPEGGDSFEVVAFLVILPQDDG